MHSQWADLYAKQHIDELRRDARGSQLARERRPAATREPADPEPAPLSPIQRLLSLRRTRVLS